MAVKPLSETGREVSGPLVGEAGPMTTQEPAGSTQATDPSITADEIAKTIANVDDVGEEQWKTKKDLLSNYSAEWMLQKIDKTKDVEAVLQGMGEESDVQMTPASTEIHDKDEDKPVASVAPQIAHLAIKAACEKDAEASKAIGKVSLYRSATIKGPELSPEQYEALREPTPGLPSDLSEFQRIVAHAKDEFVQLINKAELTEKEIAGVARFGESIEDFDFASDDFNKGKAGSASSGTAAVVAKTGEAETTAEKTAAE